MCELDGAGELVVVGERLEFVLVGLLGAGRARTMSRVRARPTVPPAASGTTSVARPNTDRPGAGASASSGSASGASGCEPSAAA
jgi:hypothetical protein